MAKQEMLRVGLSTVSYIFGMLGMFAYGQTRDVVTRGMWPNLLAESAGNLITFNTFILLTPCVIFTLAGEARDNKKMSMWSESIGKLLVAAMLVTNQAHELHFLSEGVRLFENMKDSLFGVLGVALAVGCLPGVEFIVRNLFDIPKKQ